MTMQIRKISKGGHRHRTVYCPSPEEMASYRTYLPELAKLERQQANHFGVASIAHAFIQGRNQVTCALRHVGYEATYCFDLASWFDSITTEQLINSGVDKQIAERITIGGKLRQGIPTSPTAANIAAVRFDRAVFTGLNRHADRYGPFSYTRYADDIAISWSDSEDSRYVATVVVVNALKIFDWKISPAKTRFYRAKAGRRIICGIAVGESDIQPTRETRRRLRAAKHRPFQSRVKNLETWAKCLLPRSARGIRRLAGINNAAVKPNRGQQPKETIKPILGSTRRLFFGEKNERDM